MGDLSALEVQLDRRTVMAQAYSVSVWTVYRIEKEAGSGINVNCTPSEVSSFFLSHFGLDSWQLLPLGWVSGAGGEIAHKKNSPFLG